MKPEYVIVKYSGPNGTTMEFWDGNTWVAEYPDAARFSGIPKGSAMPDGWSEVVCWFGLNIERVVARSPECFT